MPHITVNELYRRSSFELESQTSGDEPSNELTLAVIDEGKRDGEKQKQLREWRRCSVSPSEECFEFIYDICLSEIWTTE